MEYEPRKCEGCDEMFSGPPKKRFHSKECTTRWQAVRREESRMTRPAIEKTCTSCCTPIEERVDSLGRRLGAQDKFCSEPCREREKRRRLKIAAGLDPDIDGRTTVKLDARTIKIIDAVREFLDPENPVGVRSCCYHLLTLGILKSTTEFDGVQTHITNARRRDEGDNSLDDDCFEDRSRKLEYRAGWPDVNDFMETVRGAYSRDHWVDQSTIPIILCEKDGFHFLKQVTDPEHVRLFLSTGGHGRSHLCKFAENCADIIRQGKRVKVGYFGDFDADGLDMEERAENGNDKKGVERKEGVRQILEKDKIKYRIYNHDEMLTWTRLGLTEKQLLGLPISARVAAKRTSNNFEKYAEKYAHLFTEQLNSHEELLRAFGDCTGKCKEGKACGHAKHYDTHVYGGEADALGAKMMKQLTQSFIDDCKDSDLWDEGVSEEEIEKAKLQDLTL